MSGVAVPEGHATAVALVIPGSPTEFADGEEMKAGTHKNLSGALEGKLDALVFSGRLEVRDSVCGEAEAMRRSEADKKGVCCPSGMQETVAGVVSDSACWCQMNGEGRKDVTGHVLDGKETAESLTMVTKSSLEGRDSGELKEPVEVKEEAPNNFLESTKSLGKYEATSAASERSTGNIPNYQFEFDPQGELLEQIPGHEANDINDSEFSVRGQQICSNSFVDDHIETLESLETTKDKLLALKGATFSSECLKETDEKEFSCDGSGIPFENVSTSHKTRDTLNVELSSSILTDCGTNKKCSNNYSIEELLALRLTNVEGQQERWTYIYSHLGPVARELDEIAASEQPRKSRDNVDRKQRKKGLKDSVPEVSCFQVSHTDEISASEQPRKSRKNVDRKQRRRKLKDAVPEVSCSQVSHTDSRLFGESVIENLEEDHESIGTGTSDYVLSVNPDAENVEKDHEDIGTPDCVLSVNADVNSAIEVECEEYESSDDEYNSIQRPAFSVEGEPDFESGPPQDGLEYLRRVRWEAMQIPNVKVAKLDKSKLKVEQTPYMPSIPEIADCPNDFVPSQHWVETFLTDFSELKQALSQMGGSDIDASSSRKILDKQGGEFRLSSKMPLLSVILNLDAVSQAAILRKHVQVLEHSQTLSRRDLEWAFALFLALDEPVNAETAASIRCLLRKCAHLRASKVDYDDDVVMMNIIITIAGKYFGQSDK
ncbi:uncharacterized protein LOC116251491 [Nymphaea colorata]|nr:uncharacterized protein LOC116251491 [Nymphaea colorata]